MTAKVNKELQAIAREYIECHALGQKKNCSCLCDERTKANCREIARLAIKRLKTEAMNG